MPVTRRDLLMAGASAAALLVVPRPLVAHLGKHPEPLPPIEDPRLRELAFKGVAAAKAAGAAYADARLTHTRQRKIGPRQGIGEISDREHMAVGVRAMVNGYWGFASSALWSADEMARLGGEAVAQARANALGRPRTIALADTPTVQDGRWVTPVQRDPFDTDIDEVVDLLYSLELFVQRFPGLQRDGHPWSRDRNYAQFEVQEKAFASSGGSYCTQRLYTTSGEFVVLHRPTRTTLGLDTLTPSGMGWELYTGQPLRDNLRMVIEEIRSDLALPAKPVEVGRYDTVCDAPSMARLVDQTLGRATELDRALGHEANAGGTSYINEPIEMAGTLQVASPLVKVTGDRVAPGGAATVGWDDDGVAPHDFALVDQGILQDFQTTRESAGWLAEHYRRRGGAIRSHGCAAAYSAMEAPLTRNPNLTLHPGSEAGDFDTLVGGIDKGIAIRGLGLEMDFQNISGLGFGRMYEVKGGKRVARLQGAGVLFRAPDLWKSLTALGGQASLRRFGTSSMKGEPPQQAYHSVSAPPGKFTQVSVIDPWRKA